MKGWVSYVYGLIDYDSLNFSLDICTGSNQKPTRTDYGFALKLGIAFFKLLKQLLNFFSNRRDYLEQIADDAISGDFENRGFGIVVYRDQNLA